MTDEQIIKALECCPYHSNCEECPCDSFCDKPNVYDEAVSLIQRQKAEIERLKAELEKRPLKLIITRLPKEGEQ